MKFFSLLFIVFGFLFIIGWTPHAEAKHGRCRSHASFGMNFGVARPAPQYIAYPVAPAPIVVMPYNAPAYYYPQPYLVSPVMVQRPAVISPQFSFSFWR